MVRVHFIGIGGAGLSPIATVLLQQGYRVSGSDAQASAATERLAELGAKIFIGQKAENLSDDFDVVIISSAIAADNPELLEARRRGLPVKKRADWLGQMMEGKVGIAVAGTHGKTTTTAMIAFVLQQLGQQPTYIIGGFVPQMDTNAAAGQGTAFVIEADEYDYMFLGLKPQLALVTAVEWDHPDIFPTFSALQQAFRQFVRLAPPEGLVIACGDAPGVREVVAQAVAPVVTYGLEPGNDWQALQPQPNMRGGYDFKVARQAQSSSQVSVSLVIPGLHNVYNALAVLVVAERLGLDLAQVAELLGEFKGAARRFQLKGQVGQITIIDDYAHHPTEIRVNLAAARTRFPGYSIWALFQPHTFSRTISLLDDFVKAFDEADHVIMVDIFASRERDEGLINSRELVDRMRHPDARYIGPLAEAADYLAEHLKEPAVLLTLGAGDGYLVGEWVLEKLSEDDKNGWRA
jgi:UDP-N-acetylmuramate--alanine ligase